jgi:hypothetical protein
MDTREAVLLFSPGKVRDRFPLSGGSMLGGVLRKRLRDPDGERRPFIGLADDVNIPSMQFHDLLDQRKADPQTFQVT